ncbi:RNAse P Rpr2/Rpp21/SNM1 subunit domain-containing protein [Apiospora rasikravindrae]|uniref:RNAse P Rpr2/Rpp21/SNM1 subunit domain-containing protein n=1 Tax=Apiospora rasikravindrae TaxID=990691 RepID=A0ABR1S1S3_9PEZI
MAKPKGQQGSVPNRPIYSRISYLYQAASHLAASTRQDASLATGYRGVDQPTRAKEPTPDETQLRQACSRHLLTTMRTTSEKAVIRLSPALKHTVCKYCDSLLIEGETCVSVVENASKGGAKRFPVGASRQKKQKFRSSTTPVEEAGVIEPATG